MQKERHHRIYRSRWLRAAVLGANDGVVSTASLITGITAAQCSHEMIITSALAGLIAGALSMAGGEYVSVCSQHDTENADLELERNALKKNAYAELIELSQIYVNRGLSKDLANQVARQLTNHNALDAHARDELGISVYNQAKPMQAAIVSAISFAIGAFLPLLTTIGVSYSVIIPSVIISSIICLIILGILSAYTGGAPIIPATIRITILGTIAMALTTGLGSLLDNINILLIIII